MVPLTGRNPTWAAADEWSVAILPGLTGVTATRTSCHAPLPRTPLFGQLLRSEGVRTAMLRNNARWRLPSKPGIEQQPLAGTWLTFTDTVGGRPLGPEPQSAPLKGAGNSSS